MPGRLLAGDPAAVGMVVRWIAETLAAPRFWRLRSEWLDLHQEVMLRVVASLRDGRFDSTQGFRVYVEAIARNTALKVLRDRRGQDSAAPAETGRRDPCPDPYDRAAAAQLARLALGCATEECRRLILAYFYDQKNYAEIAASIDVPVGTVKSRLSRCLKDVARSMRRSTPRQRVET